MNKLIKTRHLETRIDVNSRNKISVQRRVYTDSNGYYHIENLYGYLKNVGVADHWSGSRWENYDTIAEIMPRTAEIEHEIDRAVGEHAGIAAALSAELDALTEKDEKIQALSDEIERLTAMIPTPQKRDEKGRFCMNTNG